MVLFASLFLAPSGLVRLIILLYYASVTIRDAER